MSFLAVGAVAGDNGAGAIILDAPAGAIDGDIITLVAFFENSASTALTFPVGFDQIIYQDVDISGNAATRAKKVWVAQKVASSEPATYTITVPVAIVAEGYSISHRGRGGITSTPVYTGLAADGTGTITANLTGYTATEGDDVIVIGGVAPDTANSVDSFTPATNYTERSDVVGAWLHHTLFTRDALTAGATGAISFDAVTNAGNAAGYGIVLPLATAAVNTAPVIDTPEADIVEPAGTAWTRDISDNSSDADLDTLTYSVSPALPTGITLNPTTGVITATTATVAQVPTNYTFTHSDGTDSVDDIVSIHITGILSVGGDNEMDNNETDVLIATTGLPASVTTFTSVKVNSVVMDNIRWNAGQPLFDAPAGMALGSNLVVEVEFTE